MFGFLSFIHYHPPSISLSLVFLDLRPRIKQGRSERMVHGFGLVQKASEIEMEIRSC